MDPERLDPGLAPTDAEFGVGGFDIWTPDLVATSVPQSVTVVLVIGTNGPLPWTP